jgi:hypothetical protein
VGRRVGTAAAKSEMYKQIRLCKANEMKVIFHSPNEKAYSETLSAVVTATGLINKIGRARGRFVS